MQSACAVRPWVFSLGRNTLQVLHKRRGDISPLVIAGLVVSALLLLVAMIFWTVRWQEMMVESDKLTHAYEVRDSSRSVLQNLLDAETGQRGYMITRRVTYLEPYRDAAQNLSADLQKLHNLTINNGEQRKAVDRVRGLVTAKLNELAATVSLVSRGESSAALALVSSDKGKAQMDSIRAILSDIVAVETSSLDSRRHWFDNSYLTMTATIIGCFVAALTTIAFTFAAMVRQIEAIGRNHRDLKNFNEGLEGRVAERTSALEASLADAKAQRNAAEHERKRVEILMRELDHRVGNSLAMVSSLLGLQLSRTTDPMIRQGLDAARLRIQTIGSSQRRLRMQDDFQTVLAGELFSAVIDDIVSVVPHPERILIKYDIDPLLLQARDATTCAILLGELVTNALKYGIDPEAGGTVHVGFHRLKDDGLELSVADNGSGGPTETARTWQDGGLGRVIMERLAQQYCGTVEYRRNNGDGTVVNVKMPGLVAVIDEGSQEPDSE